METVLSGNLTELHGKILVLGKMEAFSYGIDIDANGNIWATGVGGAAKRDAQTGALAEISNHKFFSDRLLG
ncbi:MAG: hypothetical protein MZV64_24785 [Ignavibacteriales bacterium]|nr:hypothetical protein [Ignavibacteriales bacterium]